MRISALSSPYIRYVVNASVNGLVVSPTGDVVLFAFQAQGIDPVSWFVGSWETVTGPPSQSVARIQVGPISSNVLAKGVYMVWIKIIDNPETIIRPVGQLEVF